ncbi:MULTISPECIES: DegV family protein [unclassified Mycolicibacterium]|uniref:DegV family protein n=1 Tax=unclassified Mycolicibacterium TaxID=2636767 RepID=UPI0012DBE823|nr:MULTISPECIES: DegV family protein [unclassified Mycolicibacterium]MUL83604.1 DegV family protein [Mycolicibacterium sp. CBMA 329]MUL90595.1 DegV family protein [Mycolicibacterium sp. CBMA 331]MUM00565.1 DegV family protein [Mycolicibacterium sp. CBMA 334]MUM25457.1 DegV family protein [Mycolicibacterium sp. CBMA 295]MUM41539.1 DegV family protein [Mycolicibacterium sp. CBMA 247]
MAVMVVTDSTSRLRPELCQKWGIRQVPLHILDDGNDLRDGIDPMPSDIYDRTRVTTSGASPADLADTYRRALADSDGDGVVAVHISAALSSTYSTAAAVAREIGQAVRVVNSRAAAMGVGFVALAAAESARGGGTLDAVEAAARAAIPRGRAFIVVHRLDNLRRSGRIGAAASWLGTALSFKPLLRLDVDGRLVLSQRIRTISKAHAALVDQIADAAGDRTVSVVVHHVDNLDAAEEIAAALTDRLPHLRSLSVTDMGAVLAVHVGGGAVGACITVEDA